MKKSDIDMSGALHDYLLSVSLREHDCLVKLREETAKDSHSIMQIPPEQGQFMALLIKMSGAHKALEIGTYTGYSTLCIAQALPSNGTVVACDISEQWTSIGRRYWQQAGVDHKINLHIAPAIDTLNSLLADDQQGTFDFAFIDADKTSYVDYYEKTLALLRPGGVIVIDNVFLFGAVVDPDVLDDDLRSKLSHEDIRAVQTLNQAISHDERVDISMLPVADGLTLVRKRASAI